MARDRQTGKQDSTTIKNDTNKATMLLKIKDRKRKSWNEAKKYLKTRELFKIEVSKANKLLKTNHIAFFKAANLARFLRDLAQNGA